jgi:hypothetical protein
MIDPLRTLKSFSLICVILIPSVQHMISLLMCFRGCIFFLNLKKKKKKKTVDVT